MTDAAQALLRLKEGNRRFVEELSRNPRRAGSERQRLVEGQRPFAIVLGCSDSRVPAEIVFDCGLGDLFVIRVAGNIVTPSQIGSVEFAAARFGTRLVVVLGHSCCGAVEATVESLRQPADPGSRNLKAIVDCIRPAVAPLVEAASPDDPTLIARAVRANTDASADQLRHGSPLLEALIENVGLQIVPAEYDLQSGRVTF